MLVISPDEGGMNRSVYLANVLGLDMGMFYKRRDYTHVVDGRNPVIAHEFLGTDIEGKDIIVVDDMISSGDSMLEVVGELKTAGQDASLSSLPSASSPTAWSALTKHMRKALSPRS